MVIDKSKLSEEEKLALHRSKRNTKNIKAKTKADIKNSNNSTALLPRTDRIELAFEQSDKALQKGYKKTNTTYGVARAKYMSDPETQEFHLELLKTSIVKCQEPTAFNSPQDYVLEMLSYYELCKKYNKTPSVNGVCLFLGTTIETLSRHSKDVNSPWHELAKITLSNIHDITQVGMLEGQIPVAGYKFVSQNYFGMQEKTSVEVTAKRDESGDIENKNKILEALKEEKEEQLMLENEEQ